MDHEAYIAKLERYKKVYDKDESEKSPRMQRYIDQYEADIQTAKISSKTFGALSAASGRRSVSTTKFQTEATTGEPKVRSIAKEPASKKILWPMDWALIKLGKERDMVNRLPNKAVVTMAEPRKLETGIVPNMKANTWTLLNTGACNTRRDDVHVAKCGRSTGCTLGLINHAIVAINSAHNGYEAMANHFGYTQDHYGYCWSMMMKSKKQGLIISNGDSGSICIHDPSGAWLGLIFGESGCGSALMMSIDLVFQDIENVMGCKITEPKFVVVP